MTSKNPTLASWLKLFSKTDAPNDAVNHSAEDVQLGLSDLQLDALVASEMGFEDLDDDVKSAFEAHEPSRNRFAVLREEQKSLSPLVERLLKNVQQELATELAAERSTKSASQEKTPKNAVKNDVTPQETRSWLQSLKDSWARLALYGTPLAAGAAALFFMTQTPSQDPLVDVKSPQHVEGAGAAAQLPNGVRSKGSDLSFFIKRDKKTWRGHSGDEVLAGDALRFERTNGPASHFLLFAVDAKGNLSALAPFGAVKSQQVDEGIKVALDGSLVLDDDDEGTERIIGLYSNEAFSLAQLQAVMNAHLAKGVAPGAAIGEALLRERLSETKLGSMLWPGFAHVVTLSKKTSAKATKSDEERK
ncbi:MAG: hypothetical protein GY822_00635 [Deltaproteobacteria bacterium]|nr:hypothetical protein [Deltaproteobacteria bacterium]